MDNEKLLQAISDMLDKKLDERLKPINDRLDKIDSRLDVIEVKQNKMSDQLTELQLSQRLFELNTNKKLARLQDGMDTVEEVLKMNEMLPR